MILFLLRVHGALGRSDLIRIICSLGSELSDSVLSIEKPTGIKGAQANIPIFHVSETTGGPLLQEILLIGIMLKCISNDYTL